MAEKEKTLDQCIDQLRLFGSQLKDKQNELTSIEATMAAFMQDIKGHMSSLGIDTSTIPSEVSHPPQPSQDREGLPNPRPKPSTDGSHTRPPPGFNNRRRSSTASKVSLRSNRSSVSYNPPSGVDQSIIDRERKEKAAIFSSVNMNDAALLALSDQCVTKAISFTQNPVIGATPVERQPSGSKLLKRKESKMMKFLFKGGGGGTSDQERGIEKSSTGSDVGAHTNPSSPAGSQSQIQPVKPISKPVPPKTLLRNNTVHIAKPVKSSEQVAPPSRSNQGRRSISVVGDATAAGQAPTSKTISEWSTNANTGGSAMLKGSKEAVAKAGTRNMSDFSSKSSIGALPKSWAGDRRSSVARSLMSPKYLSAQNSESMEGSREISGRRSSIISHRSIISQSSAAKELTLSIDRSIAEEPTNAPKRATFGHHVEITIEENKRDSGNGHDHSGIPVGKNFSFEGSGSDSGNFNQGMRAGSMDRSSTATHDKGRTRIEATAIMSPNESDENENDNSHTQRSSIVVPSKPMPVAYNPDDDDSDSVKSWVGTRVWRVLKFWFFSSYYLDFSGAGKGDTMRSKSSLATVEHIPVLEGFHPYSPFIGRWEFLLSFVYIATLYEIPVAASFEKATVSTAAIEMPLTILFLIAIILRMFTLKEFNGQVVPSIKTAQADYIRHGLVLDLIGALPLATILKRAIRFPETLLLLKLIETRNL
ncbi:hypothetical protein HDU76_004513, partial [Blyttiomyces sp. JEL0837]